MAPFGDGGGEEDDGGGDARRGWDPLRSGSAPPTMEGSAAAAVAAEGMLRDGGGPAVGSFFSGVGGLGARLDEVSRRRGAVAQVKGVLGLELIEDSEHIGNSASLFVGQQGLLFNGMTELEERQFGPSRVHSVGPVANYSAFDVASLWSDTETDKAKFCKHVQNRFLPNTEMMNAYGTRDLTAPYFSESDLSDALSGLRLSNSTVMNERNHEEELLDEMLKRRRDFSTKLCDDNRSHLDGNFFHSPRSERLDAHSPSVYGDDRNGVDSLELVDVVGHVKEVRQYGSIWKSVYPTKTGECIS
ncbi:hypothetical protein PR202_gb25847 [Eleusine coracana subsp. coracana]|uniref:Uncharacterized protein n=1 Tax=Eleusine coracana subsp. coracana TaxID=191504 RepID=A0AAV5FPN5_ELECO|nr:hypothetical protein PR202_gb25847 [Eleusine coracana subsp. coracana]